MVSPKVLVEKFVPQATVCFARMYSKSDAVIWHTWLVRTTSVYPDMYHVSQSVNIIFLL